eukprot:gene8141-9556_t
MRLPHAMIVQKYLQPHKTFYFDFSQTFHRHFSSLSLYISTRRQRTHQFKFLKEKGKVYTLSLCVHVQIERHPRSVLHGGDSYTAYATSMMKSTLIVLMLAFLAFASASTNQVNNAEECTLCQYLTNYAIGFVDNNSTVAEVQAELEKVCTFVPSELKSTCDSIIASYTQEIINSIFSGETSETICTKIGFCSTTTVNVGGEAECALCSFLVAKTEKYVMGNTTASTILSILNTDCNALGSLAGTCQTIVKVYASGSGSATGSFSGSATGSTGTGYYSNKIRLA